MTTDWLDRVAGDLLEAEHEVRRALRAIAYRRPDPLVHRSTPGCITLLPNQARALLRGVMPATIAVTSRRKHHARLVAALTLFARQAVALNDPNPRAAEAPIAAAADLVDALREWLRLARWEQATRLAGVSWRAPRLSITDVMRLATASTAEHRANAPDAERGLRNSPYAPLRFVRQLAAARAEQLALDLAPPAETADVRQLRLPLQQAA